MTAVVGISSSSRADLDRALAALGTNLLTVGPGNTMFGDSATLPDESVSMISRIGPVYAVAAIGAVSDTAVYRTNRIPTAQTGGISVAAAQPALLSTVGASLACGNACVVKPAEDACLSLLRFAELALEVGFPPGVLNVVTGLGEEAGAALFTIAATGHGARGENPARGDAVDVDIVWPQFGGEDARVVGDARLGDLIAHIAPIAPAP